MTPLDSALPHELVTDLHLPVARRRPSLPPGLIPLELPSESQGALLRDAIRRLRDAEATIAEQRERIEHLETLSMTDELTGLLNRRGLIDAFRRELAGAMRGGSGGVLVMVDLDGFKAINDTHGHLCGDQYLRQVAKVLKQNVRAQDVVARLGGDEFVVLLTRTAADKGEARAEALAKRFHAAACPWQRQSLPLSASFGVQPYAPHDDADKVMRQADAAMYRVKSTRKAAR